jgi:hypothetical protein
MPHIRLQKLQGMPGSGGTGFSLWIFRAWHPFAKPTGRSLRFVWVVQNSMTVTLR